VTDSEPGEADRDQRRHQEQLADERDDQYRRLDGASDEFCTNINYPATDMYRFEGAFKAINAANDEIYVRVMPGNYVAWDVANVYGSWRWSNSGPTVHLSPGIKTTCIKAKGAQIVDVDAILLRRL
jgi:hypothetical protein